MHTKMRGSFGAAIVCAIAAVTAGCGDTDAAVFVEAGIDTPSASVSAGSLGTNLSGSFRLVFRLGSRASGPSQVTAQSFAIMSADQKTTVVSPLEVATITPGFAFPVTVQPGDDDAIDFFFDTKDAPLGTEKLAELCAAGGMRIGCVVIDSLSGEEPVTSQVFTPAGCP